MGFQKIYSKTEWQNSPSTTTALGRTNLYKMEVGIDTLDNRVVELDTSKANQAIVNDVVQSIIYNEDNGILTIIKVNGTSTNIDTKLAKITVNFTYNPETQQLIITLKDGTEQYVDLSSLITEYEFVSTDTVDFIIVNGKVSANIPNGSITADKLQPGYLAEVTVQANTATVQAQLAKRYALGGVEEGDEIDNAKYYAQQSANSAALAQEYSDIVFPNLYIDLVTGKLMSVGGQNIFFTINDNGHLISEVIF